MRRPAPAAGRVRPAAVGHQARAVPDQDGRSGEVRPALKGYFLPEGFKLEIVIDDPDTINPVGMTFAPGRHAVRHGVAARPRHAATSGSRSRRRSATGRHDPAGRDDEEVHHRPGEAVQVQPRDREVRRAARSIIAEELPSTHPLPRRLALRHRPRHRAALAAGRAGRHRRPGTERPANPNDPWNVREIIAQGFCGFHHHQVSGLTIGNDGLLYITSGDDDNFVEGSDGSRATVLRTGAVFRCKPDGSKMETYSLGYRNPYRDLAYDDKFNWFHADNDNEDGSKFTGCRLMHVAEGADFGWRLLIGARCCRPDHARGAVAGELPGKVPPMLKTGRGSPAGLLIYNDTRLPEQYRGLLYYPDVFRKLVRAYKVAPDGATFKITHEFEFLKSDDPLFRPCQMVTGPDGAIYVCDWRTDSGGAGKLSGDGKHGRIYRITWAGTKDSPALPRRGDG